MARQLCQTILRLLLLQLMSKQYNILCSELPDYVTLYGIKYPVHTSFKNWIEISILAQECGMSDAKAVAQMLRLCYREELPPNMMSAVLGMLAFLNGDTDISVSSDKKPKKLYSFSEDAAAIYSAFYSKYGIDLEKSHMHWYKFCALFEGLSDDNPFKTLIRIRTMDETAVKDEKTRRKIVNLKAKYSLELPAEVDVAENISSLF
ncbi:MAG: hypothetical protein J6R66_02840 [Clostridia bacterium]|nr:hypothetical protein [Clostridia bacterium]